MFKKLKEKALLRKEEEYEAELDIDNPGGTDGPDGSGTTTEAAAKAMEKTFESGTFLNSLDELNENDIELSEVAKKGSGIQISEILRRIVFTICLVTFIISCGFLVKNLIDKRRATEIYSKLEEDFFSTGFTFDASDAFNPEEGAVTYLAEDSGTETLSTMSDLLKESEKDASEDSADDVVVTKEYNEQLEKLRAGLASLAQINPDVYGWITVEGTNINYPLVQGDDNDYYLDHAYTGDYLPNGSIFVDYRCNESITKNFNTVIYGHNITTGEMFHDVTKFFKTEYFEDTYIYIYTLDGIFVYEPFSIYETRYDYNYFKTGFSSAESFIKFANQMRDNSKLQKDVTFTKNDRVLTLSTCTNGATSARYALHAKLVKTILN